MSIVNILHEGHKTTLSHNDLLHFDCSITICKLYIERKGTFLRFKGHCGCVDDYFNLGMGCDIRKIAELIAISSAMDCIPLEEKNSAKNRSSVFLLTKKRDGDFMEMENGLL